MTRWTVQVGDDQLVIETTPDGHVRLDITTEGPILASHREVEEIRLKLGAALGDDTPSPS